MNDITALMATMKAAAELIAHGYKRNWIVSHDDETCWVGANDDDGNLTPFIEVSIGDWSDNKADNERLAAFIALAHPANVLALVEALEKAQRANAAQDDHINQQQDRIDQLEKGHQHAVKRVNSWRRLAKQSIAEQEKCVNELDASRQRIVELHRKNCELDSLTQRWAVERAGNADRIAELESRTVTVKLPNPLMPAQHNSGELFMTSDNVRHGGYLNRDDVLHNLRAAGIQVIEGGA